nr:hypothetical protein [Tanacetum cinerariifolium]
KNIVCGLNKKKGDMNVEVEDHDETRVSGGDLRVFGGKDGAKNGNDSGDEIRANYDKVKANCDVNRANCGEFDDDTCYDTFDKKTDVEYANS